MISPNVKSIVRFRYKNIASLCKNSTYRGRRRQMICGQLLFLLADLSGQFAVFISDQGKRIAFPPKDDR